MSITGKWINVYHSTMDLTQTDTGFIYGSYSSTTGSSGAYYILGLGNPNTDPNLGQSLALSILWRSYEGGQGDPSWHYVSGFSGQSIVLNGQANLILLHDLVATAPFPGVVPEPGSYLDKLVYTPNFGDPAPSGLSRKKAPLAKLGSPIDGVWQCLQDSSITLTLSLEDAQWGTTSGTLVWQGHSLPAIGFADPYAVSGALTQQGVTISTFLPSTGQAIALAGSLDLTTGNLTLAQLISQGTAPTALWTQTLWDGLNFVRA